MLTPWRFRTMGAFTAHRNDTVVDRFATQKTGALLAYLLLDLHQSHSRENLALHLWHDASLDVLRVRLNQGLSSLRRQFEPPGTLRGSVIQSDRRQVRLNPAAVSVDLYDFQRHLEAARDRTPGDPVRIAALHEAVNLYQGELFPGYYEDWIVLARDRLAEDFVVSLRSLTSELEQIGEVERALLCAQRWTAIDGANGEAHDVYARLVKRVGGNPIVVSAPPRNGHPVETPVPAARREAFAFPETARLFGRDREMERCLRVLEQTRHVRLHGLPGIGKTSLSLAIAERLSHSGVTCYFVRAERTDDQGEMLAAICRELPEVGHDRDVRATLASFFGGGTRPRLLVLDDIDRWGPPGAEVVRWLLEVGPALRLITTALHCHEHESSSCLRLEPLPLPHPCQDVATLAQNPSVRLFLHRARQVRPDFQVTTRNGSALATLLTRLDGIPLAIELAASRIHLVTPSQMVNELGHRFRFLARSRPGGAGGYTSLQAAYDEAIASLPEDLCDLFQRLSVFRGTWDLEAVRGVLGEADLDHAVQDLIDLGLIKSEFSDHQMAYRMLDTLREYAWESLETSRREEAQAAHARYYLGLLCETAPALGMVPDSWLETTHRHYPNFRAAHEWLEATSGPGLLRLVSRLAPYWEARCVFAEGVRHLERALAVVSEHEPAELAAARIGLGRMYWHLGDMDRARAFHLEAREGFASVGSVRGIAFADYNLGTVAIRQGRTEDARALFAASRAASEASGDRAGVGRALLNLGSIAVTDRDFETAQAHYEQSLRIEQELHNTRRQAYSLVNLGLLARQRSDFALARLYLIEAIAVSHQAGHAVGAAMARLNLGMTASDEGDVDLATRELIQALEEHLKLGDRYHACIATEELAKVAFLQGQYERGIRLYAGVAAYRESIGLEPSLEGGRGHRDTRKALKEAYAPERYRLARSAGRILSFEQLVAKAAEPLWCAMNRPEPAPMTAP